MTALQAAYDAVQHDLQATGSWDAATEELLADSARHREWWLGQWPEGAAFVTGLLAQDVQERVHEARNRQWPVCPEHADHPLFVEPDLGADAFWVCHRTGLPCAPIGCLPTTG